MVFVVITQDFINQILEVLDSRYFLENEYDMEFQDSANGWINTTCPLPDHEDKSPSFGFNVEKNTFNCFGCGETGNLIHLIQKIENIPFPAAIQKLSAIVGLNEEVDEYEMSKSINQIKSSIDDYLNRCYKSGLVLGLNKVSFLFTITDRINKYKEKYPHMDKFFEKVYLDIDDAFITNDLDKLNKIWAKLGDKTKEYAKRYME
jgi:hypothetical protein